MSNSHKNISEELRKQNSDESTPQRGAPHEESKKPEEKKSAPSPYADLPAHLRQQMRRSSVEEDEKVMAFRLPLNVQVHNPNLRPREAITLGHFHERLLAIGIMDTPRKLNLTCPMSKRIYEDPVELEDGLIVDRNYLRWVFETRGNPPVLSWTEKTQIWKITKPKKKEEKIEVDFKRDIFREDIDNLPSHSETLLKVQQYVKSKEDEHAAAQNQEPKVKIHLPSLGNKT